jgi:hypothetical protein
MAVPRAAVGGQGRVVEGQRDERAAIGTAEAAPVELREQQRSPPWFGG